MKRTISTVEKGAGRRAKNIGTLVSKMVTVRYVPIMRRTIKQIHKKL
jgi:hypothetical protein